MEEVFKNIVGYEGLYQVSNKGNVYSIKSKKVLKLQKDKDGYLAIGLHSKGKFKRISIHRLVGLTFIPNPENKPCINHINGNKKDNRVENLEWCTISENTKHGFDVLSRIIYNKRRVVQLTKNGEYIKTYNSLTEAGSDNGIYQQNILKVCQGKKITCGGYKWKYEEDTIDLSQV